MLIEYKPIISRATSKRRGPVIFTGNDTVYWPLAGGHYTLIDEADTPLVTQRSWRRFTTQQDIHYARTSRPQQTCLHNFLLGAKGVEHINGDGLDNRRCNLRAATPSQNNGNHKLNLTNTSGFRGVYFTKHTGRWRARLSLGRNGPLRHLGYFATAEEAAAAYDKAAREHWGEYYATREPTVRRIGDPLAFMAPAQARAFLKHAGR